MGSAGGVEGGSVAARGSIGAREAGVCVAGADCEVGWISETGAGWIAEAGGAGVGGLGRTEAGGAVWDEDGDTIATFQVKGSDWNTRCSWSVNRRAPMRSAAWSRIEKLQPAARVPPGI